MRTTDIRAVAVPDSIRISQRAAQGGQHRPRTIRHVLLALVLVVAAGMAAFAGPAEAARQKKPPNILFIIMDDVGIDQLRTLGYGGGTPPATPSIDTIARGGVRFHNAWSMPACSTSRAVFFAGRYPFRTNVYNALGPADLANSQVSPFEMTAPKLLRKKGYQSALFGKFHLGLQGNNPFGHAMPSSLGWDYFFGWLDETGDPSSIDTTAGGVAAEGTWSCGFVRGAADGGADTGACYSANYACREMGIADGTPPGRRCRDQGGIFDPNRHCQFPRPDYLDFSKYSAHYVSPLYINHGDGSVKEVPLTDIRARTYRGVVPVDAAIEWINSRPRHTPWMASVSFATVHTPIMQPPPGLLPRGSDDTNALDCANTDEQRVMSDQMIEALDREIGRLLVETGLARRSKGGRLKYEPDQTDTMIVLVGDNGTLGFTVKEPFDASRAKGTAYQTGVWVPLVVAGPLVRKPDRRVTAMVNIVDLFQLFGEIADIDVHRTVPRKIDSEPMLAYLTNPRQKPIRRTNFTQIGLNLQANGGVNGPCAFADTCSQIPVSKSVCEDNAGTWWGPEATPPATPQKYCCNVNQVLVGQGKTPLSIQPLWSTAIRNDEYKIVTNFTQAYDEATNACVPTTNDEFYAIDEAIPVPLLDEDGDDLLQKHKLTREERRNYRQLSRQLAAILDSQPPCPGDGNIDGVVNGHDLVDYNVYRTLSAGLSSWYDFNIDGLTDDTYDLPVIQENLGTKCGRRRPRG